MTFFADGGALPCGKALPPYSSMKINSRKTESGRRETMLGELIRLYMFDICGVANEEIALSEHGKPYLPMRSDIKYNISHSHGVAAGIIMTNTDAGDVGCDVEHVKRDVDGTKIERIMRRFYTDGERDAVASAYDPILEFYRIWTRKEAYIKYTAEGLARPLRSFDTVSGIRGVTTLSYTVTDCDGYEFVLSVCVPKEREKEISAPIKIIRF